MTPALLLPRDSIIALAWIEKPRSPAPPSRFDPTSE